MAIDRLRPLAPDEGSPEVRALLELTERNGRPPVTMALLAHHEPLLEPFLRWASALALSGALPRRDHEILALRVAHRMRSRFEWDEHAGFAADAGLTPAEIEAVATPDDPATWNDAERALLAAADDLVAHGRITDETYATLAEHHTPPALVEIPMVVGQYAMLSMLCGFAGID